MHGGCMVRRAPRPGWQGRAGLGAGGWVGRGCRCAAHSQLPSMSVMYAMRVLVAPSSAFSRKRFDDGLRAFGLAGGLGPGSFRLADGRSWEEFPTGLPSTGEVRAVTPTSGPVTPTSGPANELRSSLDLIAKVTSPGSATASIEPAVFFIQPEIPSRPFRAHKGSQDFFLGLLPSLICRGGQGGANTPTLGGNPPEIRRLCSRRLKLQRLRQLCNDLVDRGQRGQPWNLNWARGSHCGCALGTKSAVDRVYAVHGV